MDFLDLCHGAWLHTQVPQYQIISTVKMYIMVSITYPSPTHTSRVPHFYRTYQGPTLLPHIPAGSHTFTEPTRVGESFIPRAASRAFLSSTAPRESSPLDMSGASGETSEPTMRIQ